MMDFTELLGKYTVLLEEVKRLKKENSRLRAQLKLEASEAPERTSEEIKSIEKTPCVESITRNLKSVVDNTSDPLADDVQ